MRRQVKLEESFFEIEDTANQLYMVGSMGCALPIGLGIKKAGYQKPVCVVDGDGALLMRLGNIVLLKQLKTNGIVHIVLDNGVHDSTGGQETFSDSVDFAEIAKASGYDYVAELSELEDLPKAFDEITNSNLNGFIRFLLSQGLLKILESNSYTCGGCQKASGLFNGDQMISKEVKRNILLNPVPATTTDRVKSALVVSDICPRERSLVNFFSRINSKALKVVMREDKLRIHSTWRLRNGRHRILPEFMYE